ncbi:MAG: helix-turn-helix transcriptional regulator [Bacteroidota bacterium]|jgi:transcriptional regulator with XRE-family HTH domain
MVNRIKNLISVKNLSASQFADTLGVQRSNISHILSGRNKPSLDFILKLNEIYPEISLEWLILGKGEMFGSVIRQKTKEMALEIDFPDSVESNEIKPSSTEIFQEPMNSETAKLNENVEVKEENQAVYSRIKPDVERIEQIILLYPGGTFKTYSSEK